MSDHKQLAVLAEGLRKAHCARNDDGKGCIGECIISPTGVRLICSACGNGDEPRHPTTIKGLGRARRVIQAAGLQWDSLSIDAQASVLTELDREPKETW